jgi:hypothetical protein
VFPSRRKPRGGTILAQPIRSLAWLAHWDPPQVVSIRTLAPLMIFLGAKLGANDHRHVATPGHVQPLSLQLNGTLGHARRRQAVLREECLLSSRSRVRVTAGTQLSLRIPAPFPQLESQTGSQRQSYSPSCCYGTGQSAVRTTPPYARSCHLPTDCTAGQAWVDGVRRTITITAVLGTRVRAISIGPRHPGTAITCPIGGPGEGRTSAG